MPSPLVTALAATVTLTLSASVVTTLTLSPGHDHTTARPTLASATAPSAAATTPAPPPSPSTPAAVKVHLDAKHTEMGDALDDLSFSQLGLLSNGVAYTDIDDQGSHIKVLTTATGRVSTVESSKDPITSLDADGDRIVWSTQAPGDTGGWTVQALELGHGAATVVATGSGDELPPPVQLRGSTLVYLTVKDPQETAFHLRSLDGSLKNVDIPDCGCLGMALSSGPSFASRASDGVGLINLTTGKDHLYPAVDVDTVGLSSTHVTWIEGKDEEHQTVRSADIFSGKVTTLESSVDRENVSSVLSPGVGVGDGFAAWVETRGLVVHAVPSARETVLLDSGADPVFVVRDHRLAYIGRDSANHAVVEIATVRP